MFYCEECRVKKEWPQSWSTSFGKCEMCDKHAACYDVPSSNLPEPSGDETQAPPVFRILPPLPPEHPIKYPGIPGGKPIQRKLPVIPPLKPFEPLPANPVVAKCGACGIDLHKVMHYVCPRADCPCFPKVTC